MPSMLTHRVMGDDALRGLDRECLVMRSIDRCFEEYSIGTQGPDVFFFYAAWPWMNPQKAYKVGRYGSLLHKEKTRMMFEIMARQCRETRDQARISYTAGVLLHWAMDSIGHPYIYNRTGVGPSSHRMHRFLESQIDRGIIEWKNINIQVFKPYRIVDYRQDTHVPMYQLYSAALMTLWGEKLTEHDMYRSVADFSSLEKVLYDQYGNKMRNVRTFEAITHLNGSASSMIIPGSLDPLWDAMNEDHRLWRHPQTGEPHHESFQELFGQAVQLGRSLLRSLDEYLEGKAELESLSSQITGNFHTGLSVPEDMEFFDLVPTSVPQGLVGEKEKEEK